MAMQFMMLHYVPPSESADVDAIRAAAEGALWGAYTSALIEAGVLVGGNALQPAHTATTVRVRGDARDVEDGPYAASKEQLGGYYVIEVPDLDAALLWAARNPAAAMGAVEVRPVVARG
jgi:hypothetical protein